ncbi:MAG: M48 family metalloprotease [Chitinophagaceae bacterium]|nr:M48 family metalloprotease [Chitinophagaceae bacterium]
MKLSLPGKAFLYSFVSLIIFFILYGCSRNPVTGKKQVTLISERQEIAMGQEADPQIVAEFGLYPDSALQKFIREKGMQMAAISHRPNLNWTFRILDSDVINAFAVPGGYIYFTRGILAHLNNEAQFAGVLGHEIGHVTARHSVEQQTKQILGQVGLIAAVVIKPELINFADVAGTGLQLLMLKNSREAEKESDLLGVEYSSKVGYDAREMAKFFQTLEREMNVKTGGQRLPDFLSTHPNPGDRFVRVTRLATEWQKNNNKTDMIINRNAYLQKIQGIVYGEDPRQGYRLNNVFYHPELKFQFNTPVNWQYQNSPSRVVLAEPQGKAILLLTLGQGRTPREAAQVFVQNAKLQVTEARDVTVNGLPAFAIIAYQVQQNQSGQAVPTLQAVVYFIQYNNLIYQLAGASSPNDFSQYAYLFQQHCQSFRELTDPQRINVKPERITLVNNDKRQTLRELLQQKGIPQARFEEMAILNGMMQQDIIEPGTLIKLPARY